MDNGASRGICFYAGVANIHIHVQNPLDVDADLSRDQNYQLL